MRTVLFHCKLRKFHGGHLKLWNYFEHVLAAPGYTARVGFSANSVWDESNPWHRARDHVVEDWRSVRADAFLLGAMHWTAAERHPDYGPRTPIINLIQHVQHAEEGNERYRFLSRPAVRICVSREVRDAVLATGVARGPVLCIPNGIDLSDIPEGPPAGPRTDVLIAALKNPGLGAQVAQRLQRPGRSVRLLADRLLRPDYLAELAAADVTVFLPNPTEGFYLPALEGMAVGTLVVCPDCVGNRSFCLPGVNSYRPALGLDELVAACEAALSLPAAEATRMRTEGHAMAARFSLSGERAAFHRILQDLDALWQQAQSGG